MLRLVLAAALSILSLATLVGCPSYTVLSQADRETVDAQLTGELLFLKQSMYAGTFYDDDRFALVHPRKFEELTYLQTIEGDAIPPPPATSIIPAGTRVRVEKIEWPTGDAVFRRPLYTPRYTTWIVLRVAADRGSEVTVEREQRHIMLIPAGITDAELFDMWFKASLSAEDPNPWIVSLPAEQQAAIAQKKALVGMSYEALTAALGFPDSVARESNGDIVREVVIYGATSIVLQDGVVTLVNEPGAEG
jgi:hypothetical protein